MKLRPRFSISTLAVLLTLVCLYVGCLSLTDRFGVPAIELQYGMKPPDEHDLLRQFLEPKVYSSFPFVVTVDDKTWPEVGDRYPVHLSQDQELPRFFHLWFFGFTAKLTFGSTWTQPGIVLEN